MSNLKQRLSLNVLANVFAQFTSVAFNLLTVPLFLTFWSKSMYGEWLILSTLPAYLALSNMGLMNVAGNNMTIAVAEGNMQKARESLHTVWTAQLGLNLIIGLLLVVFLFSVNISSLLKLHEITRVKATWTLLIISFYAMLNLQMAVFSGIYRAVGYNARGVFVQNSIRLLSVFGIALGLFLQIKNPVTLAAVISGTYFFGSAFLFWDTARIAPELRPGIRYFQLSKLNTDLKHGFGFMAYPLGRAATNQGMLLFVNAFLNSSAVVTLSTIRTLVNTAFQLSNIVSLSTWPEFSRLHGEKDKAGTKRLFIFSTSMGVWLGLSAVAFLALFGTYLLSWWTRGEVIVSRSLLILFLVPVALNAAWYTAGAVFNATNQHKRMAISFLIASLIVPMVAWILQITFGLELYAVGIAFLCMELIMLIYILPSSLKLVNAGKSEWISQFVRIPKYAIDLIQHKSRKTNI